MGASISFRYNVSHVSTLEKSGSSEHVNFIPFAQQYAITLRFIWQEPLILVFVGTEHHRWKIVLHSVLCRMYSFLFKSYKKLSFYLQMFGVISITILFHFNETSVDFLLAFYSYSNDRMH